MSDANSPAVNQITNKVKINLDMFHPGVMYRIVTKMCGSKLSHNSDGVVLSLNPSSCRRECIQTVSEAAFARALYSASVEDRATARCFFKLHETGLEPRKIIYTDVDVRSSSLPAQFAFEKVVRDG